MNITIKGKNDSALYVTHREKVNVNLLSRVQLFATPWTVAYQASLSMEFSRQEDWSGLSFPSPHREEYLKELSCLYNIHLLSFHKRSTHPHSGIVLKLPNVNSTHQLSLGI